MSPRTLSRVGLGLMGWLAAAVTYGLATGTASVALAGSAAMLLCAPVAPIVALRWLRPRTSALMRRTRRTLARRRGGGPPLAYEWVDLERIARVMRLAAVAAEDAYFRHHRGFDWESIRAARAHNRAHAAKRGASTITQQVAKNLFLWPERSYVRKALEAYLTVLVEALWPKRRILEVYLNIAQFGEDVFGVQAAALRYFAKPAADLSRQQAALLAAALPNPVKYRVSHPSHQLRFRQTMVLAAMQRLGDDYLEHI
jgi:monofunctional glycosyltransferase